jgi:hypothetical protein
MMKCKHKVTDKSASGQTRKDTPTTGGILLRGTSIAGYLDWAGKISCSTSSTSRGTDLSYLMLPGYERNLFRSPNSRNEPAGDTKIAVQETSHRG